MRRRDKTFRYERHGRREKQRVNREVAAREKGSKPIFVFAIVSHRTVRPIPQYCQGNGSQQPRERAHNQDWTGEERHTVWTGPVS